MEAIVIIIHQILFATLYSVTWRVKTNLAGAKIFDRLYLLFIQNISPFPVRSLYCNKVKQISSCGPGALFGKYIGNV